MQLAWYRKYRPQTFTEVVGQEHVRTTLRNQIKAGSFGHAYLFSGPKGTGKTSMARILARAINCLENGPSFAKATEGSVSTDKKGVLGEPCGKCAMCVAFDRGQMLDLIEIDAASNTGVDNIRDLIDKLNLAPSMGKFKVYVIDETHMLSKGAFNALLKTLEEPPVHVVFVLATTEPHKLPPTIISRCQRFDFKYLSIEGIAKWLTAVAGQEKIKLESGVAETIASESGGGMRDALSLLEQAAAISSTVTKEQLTSWLGLVDWSAAYQLMELTLGGQIHTVVARIGQIYQGGYDLHRLATAWIALTRQILAVKLGNQDLINITADQLMAIGRLIGRLSLSDIAWLMEELMLTAKELKTATVPQLPLELLVVKIARRLGQTDGDKPTDGGSSTVQPPAAAAPGGDPDAARRAAAAWPQVVNLVRSTHPTLSGILSHAQADERDGKLRLTFGSNFHKEILDQPASRQAVVGALSRLGFNCTMECAVDPAPKRENEVAVEEVLQVFGKA